jgi:hypothetical protein
MMVSERRKAPTNLDSMFRQIMKENKKMMDILSKQ